MPISPLVREAAHEKTRRQQPEIASIALPRTRPSISASANGLPRLAAGVSRGRRHRERARRAPGYPDEEERPAGSAPPSPRPAPGNALASRAPPRSRPATARIPADRLALLARQQADRQTPPLDEPAIGDRRRQPAGAGARPETDQHAPGREQLPRLSDEAAAGPTA